MLQQTLWGEPEPIEDDGSWTEPRKAEQKPQKPMTDPRPDLSYDSGEWTKLLRMAQQVDRMLAGTLHGFRCGGLRLHRGGKGWALRPDLDPKTSIWSTPEQYIKDRDKWLQPYREQVVKLLQQLGVNA